MNRLRRSSWLPIVATLALAACKSADKGAATGSNVDRAADQIEQGARDLDSTVAALRALVETPGPDLVKQRKAFEKSLSSLESSAEKVRETGQDMRNKRQAYFDEWNAQVAQIQNEEIREQSNARRAEIEQVFTKLEEECTQTKDSFAPVIGDLRDIRTALQADSTLGGLESLKGPIEDVNERAAPLSESLKDLAKRFRELGANLSRMGPKPAETAAQ